MRAKREPNSAHLGDHGACHLGAPQCASRLQPWGKELRGSLSSAEWLNCHIVDSFVFRVLLWTVGFRSEWKVSRKGGNGLVWDLDQTFVDFIQQEKIQNRGRSCFSYPQDYLPKIYEHAQLWHLRRRVREVSCSHLPHSATTNLLPVNTASGRCWNAAFDHSPARRRAPPLCVVTTGQLTDPPVPVASAVLSPAGALSRWWQESGKPPCASYCPRCSR